MRENLLSLGFLATTSALGLAGCALSAESTQVGATLAGKDAAATSYPTCTAGMVNTRRLGVALEIHVENSSLSVGDQTDYVLDIAREAAEAGVKLSFGFGVDFLDEYDGGVSVATTDHGSVVLADLVTLLEGTFCHEVTLHADVPDLEYAEALAYLQDYTAMVTSAGGTGSVASGVCTESATDGGWLKAAHDAGIQTIAGVVEDCQVTLDSTLFPDDARTADECSPLRCHGAAPEGDPAQRASGWMAETVTNWIAPFVPATVVEWRAATFIIGSFGEANAPCLAEQAAGLNVSTECSDGFRPADGNASDDYSTAAQGAADAAVMLSEIGDVVDSWRSGTRGDAFHTAYSTNLVTTTDWLDGFFNALATGLASGTTAGGHALAGAATFTTLGPIGRVNRQEARP